MKDKFTWCSYAYIDNLWAKDAKIIKIQGNYMAENIFNTVKKKREAFIHKPI